MSANKEIEYADTSRYSHYVDDAFYARLIKGLQEWDREGTPVDGTIRAECEALLFREARLLDNAQFEEWLNLFTSQCLYWIPTVPGGGDPRREVSLVFDDRRRLEDRVFWLQCGYAYSQTPRSRTSRMVGNIEVFYGKEDGELRIRSNFIIHEFRQGKSRSLAGWYGHRLLRQDDKWQISLKQVNLIDSDQGHDNLTFLL